MRKNIFANKVWFLRTFGGGVRVFLPETLTRDVFCDIVSLFFFYALLLQKNEIETEKNLNGAKRIADQILD